MVKIELLNVKGLQKIIKLPVLTKGHQSKYQGHRLQPFLSMPLSPGLAVLLVSGIARSAELKLNTGLKIDTHQ